MGWVTIHDNKRYELCKVVGHKTNEHGIEVPIKVKFRAKTKKDAEAKYQEYLRKNQQGISTDTEKYFGIEADKWIEAFFWQSKASDRTKNLYVRAWNKYIRPLPLYTAKLNNINLITMQNAYNNLLESGATPSGLRSAHKLMRQFYKYLASQGYAQDFTANLITPERDKLKANDEIVIWSDEELKTIFEGLQEQNPQRIRFLMYLAYYTGCRISELLAVKYEDFKEDGLHIERQVQITFAKDESGKRVSKLSIDALKSQNSKRIIPLHAKVLEELELHRAWHWKEAKKNGYIPEYVFTTSNGTFYDRRNLWHITKRFYKSIGVDEKGYHTFRHTFGTNLCRAGVPIQVASVLLGHSDISITQKYYVNVHIDTKQQAISMLSSFVN